ncbi:MAG: glycosyltransferase family 2 protein [Clostridia bacterium]|nr:glycosyltransferase family 2 protein [Clostridia bacterium]
MNRTCPRLFIIVPCYNEEAVLPTTAPMFLDELSLLQETGRIDGDSRVLFVNDGSRDRTWSIIEELSHQDPRVQGISQSRNRGHQNAVLAGLMESIGRCDVTISIDCDGQDDIHAMEKMLDEYLAGSDVVYGVRSSRDTDTFIKRFTAESFYKFLRSMGAEVIFNHADYRLMSARVIEAFSEYHEVNLFLRGLIPLVGFRSTSVYYERHERLAGESHYPLHKMIALAFDGITSLSTRPIRIITLFGLVMALLSLIGILWIVLRACTGHTVAGWASTACIVCFMGGVQSFFLGVIGEYIGKIYLETKHRPRYILSECTDEMQEGPEKAEDPS